VTPLRPVTVAVLGGAAVGLWSAQQVGSPLPLLALALVGAGVARALGAGVGGQVLAATVALSAVAGRTFGYAGTGLVEVDELVVPLLPLTAGLLLAVTGPWRDGVCRATVAESVRDHRLLWALAGWTAITTLWADRPAVALTVGCGWLALLLGAAVGRVGALDASYGVLGGAWAVMVASNVRAWLEPVPRPSGADGATILPVDKIVGFAEDTTELADIAVSVLFLALLPRDWRVRLFGIALSVVTIVRTDQRAAMIAAGVGLLVLAASERRHVAARVGVAAMLVVGAVGVVALQAGWLDLDRVSRGDGSDLTTLSRRTDLWNAALDERSDWLPLGRGPGSEELVAALPDSALVVNLHNRLLQWAVTLGAVGVALVGACGGLVWRMRKRLPTAVAAAGAATLVSGLAVPGFGGVGLTPATLVLAVWVYAAGSARREAPHLSGEAQRRESIRSRTST
jgi:hypothetical protein